MSRRAVFAALSLAWLLSPNDCEAASGKRHVRVSSAAVALTSPLPTDSLTAGDSILLSWDPLPELERYPFLAEWEAFLSVDGGATYPLRLTPHLDLDRRRFAMTVPEIPTSQARLMMRFGDERQELEFEFPGIFEIRPARRAVPEWTQVARGRGESARDGDLGVASWVVGSRAGHGARRVVAGKSGTQLEGIETCGFAGLLQVGPLPVPPQAVPASSSTHPFAALFPAPPRAPAAPPRASTLEPFRRTCRQNE